MEIQINACESNLGAFEGASTRNPDVLTFSLHLSLLSEFSMEEFIGSWGSSLQTFWHYVPFAFLQIIENPKELLLI